MNITTEQITSAYDSVIEAKKQLFAATLDVIKTKDNYEYNKLLGLANGTIKGANSDMRDASAMEQLKDIYEAYKKAKSMEEDMHFKYDIANLELDKVRMLMRYEEIVAIKD